jgi:sterol desaturase/sphingolipid hydroxylase (fatty acid hydroxylase superfamily)
MLASLLLAKNVGALPTCAFEVEETPLGAALKCGLLLVFVDLVQFCVHSATHKKVIGRRVYSSHMLHHAHKSPSPDTAFETGILDSVLQLVFPVWLGVWTVGPDYSACCLASFIYSNWLLYIHTGEGGTRFSSWIFISPEKHAKHHSNPSSYLSHLIDWEAVWDRCYVVPNKKKGGGGCGSRTSPRV